NIGKANIISRTTGKLTPSNTKTNKIRHVQPTINHPKTRGCDQPRLTDSMNPFTKPPNPRVTTRAPIQSTCPPVGLRLSGTRQSEIAITAAANGRLMKKTQRQEACSTSQPPSTGPTAVVIAVKPDHVPIAWPRLCSSKDVLMIARLPGTSSAAPTP